MNDTSKQLREVLDSNARASCEADREVLAMVHGVIGERDKAIKERDKMRAEINILEDRGLYRENDLRSIIGLLGLTKDEAVVVGWPGIRARIENLVRGRDVAASTQAADALAAERDELRAELDAWKIAEERLCAQFAEVCRSRDVYSEETAWIREALVGVRWPGESTLETVGRLVAAHLSNASAGVAP